MAFVGGKLNLKGVDLAVLKKKKKKKKVVEEHALYAEEADPVPQEAPELGGVPVIKVRIQHQAYK
jgi:FAM32A